MANYYNGDSNILGETRSSSVKKRKVNYMCACYKDNKNHF